MADSEHTPTRVFVSYSHSDRPWLARLQVHLKPLVRDGSVDLWDDTRIGAGADWKGEIDQALAAAQVAVLLVSPDFLASDFVQDHEIPPLLEAASQRGCRILPVIVSHSLYGESVLGRFQAVNDPAAPLKELAEVEQDRVLRDLAQEIAAGVGGAAARAQETQRSPARLPTSGAAGASALRPPHLGWALTGLPLAACLVAVWWWVGPSRAPETTARAAAVQTQSIAGNVRDASTGRPIPDVMVSLPELGIETRTDRLGRFSMQVEGEHQGTVELMAIKDGYRLREQYASLGNTSLDINLKEDAP